MWIFDPQFAQVDLSVCYHRPRVTCTSLTWPVIYLRRSAEKKWLVRSSAITGNILRQYRVAWRGVASWQQTMSYTRAMASLRDCPHRRKSLPTRNMATCAATNNIVTNTYLTSWQSETKSMIFVNNSVQNEYFLVLESTEYYNSTFWEYEILIYLSLLRQKNI